MSVTGPECRTPRLTPVTSLSNSCIADRCRTALGIPAGRWREAAEPQSTDQCLKLLNISFRTDLPTQSVTETDAASPLTWRPLPTAESVSGHWVQWVRADLMSPCRRLCHPAPGGAGNSVTDYQRWPVTSGLPLSRKIGNVEELETLVPARRRRHRRKPPPRPPTDAGRHWLPPTAAARPEGGRPGERKKTQRSSLKGDWPSLSNGHWNRFKSNTELGHFWETGWPGRIRSIPSAQALWPSFCFRLWEFFKINIHRAYCK